MVDLPYTMVDLPDTMVDLPDTMVESEMADNGGEDSASAELCSDIFWTQNRKLAFNFWILSPLCTEI